MRKIISSFLVCSMLFSFSVVNGFAVEEKERATIERFVAEVYNDNSFSIEQIDGKAILSQFPVEVYYV